MPALAPPPDRDNVLELDAACRDELAKMIRRASREAGSLRARLSLIVDVRVTPEGDARLERIVTARVVS
jgi:hypothetical protein